MDKKRKKKVPISLSLPHTHTQTHTYTKPPGITGNELSGTKVESFS